MALGTKLKDLLTERGITVKDFAKQIGVPPTTLYSFIKRDSDDVKLELVTKICNGLGIKVTDFLKTIDCIDGKTTTIFDLTNFDENEIEKVHDKIIDESKTPTIANRFDGDKHFLDYLISPGCTAANPNLGLASPGRRSVQNWTDHRTDSLVP